MTTATDAIERTIHVTERAAQHMKKLAKNEGMNEYGLRMSVKGGGCSGLSYKLAFVAAPNDDDKIIEEHGVKLFVDFKSLFYLGGTVLDFSGGLNGKGFEFTNPNAKTTCGCGSSFSV
ncbi:MAG: iron-sulfur cluster insertion protein ErpA [Chloroflexi bacterium]|nr:iron-sulfur cluster insertion protein ErpA [Chloroflexota bacterium]